MIFWIVAGLITALCVAVLLRPLSREGEQRAGRGEASLALYRDQLDEVEKDLERGVLGEAEADAARREIERRMLRADSERKAEVTAAKGSRKRNMIAAMIVAVLFPLAGGGLYLLEGSPGQPGLPFAAREDERVILGQANAEVNQLRAGAEEDPQNPEAWIGLAQGLATIQRYGEAAAAYRQAIELSGDEGLRSSFGEMLTLAAGGSVTPEARRAFEAALAHDARDPRARYYIGLAQAQEGRLGDAIETWMALAAESTPDAPWRPVLEQAIRDTAAELGQDPAALEIPGSGGVAAGPSQDQVEAAGEMSAEERETMIRSMVDRLATRLAEDPDNPENFDDWLRLAQSYAVLGEQEKVLEALEAIKRIVDQLPDDDPRRKAYEEGLSRGGGQ